MVRSLAGLLKEGRWRLSVGVGMETWEDSLDLPSECDHVIRQAQAGEATIVNLGCLILVALSSGDAFIFDVENKLACVLCRGGERTGFVVQDRGSNGRLPGHTTMCNAEARSAWLTKKIITRWSRLSSG
jgi:hypothetical protein